MEAVKEMEAPVVAMPTDILTHSAEKIGQVWQTEDHEHLVRSLRLADELAQSVFDAMGKRQLSHAPEAGK